MKRQESNIKEILDHGFPRPSEEQMDAAGERVLKRLLSETHGLVDQTLPDADPVRLVWRLRWPAIAAVVAAVVIALLLRSTWPSRTPSAADGARRIEYGESVRSNDAAGALLALADGSRIEMRTQSELSLERADDGARIRLNKGSVIVTAAKQGAGHLYVQTKDVIVSVVGTVFLVNTEESGSRVAVIQGEVRVQQGATSKHLLPGQQVSTNSIMVPVSLEEQVSWSRTASAYRTLLQQFISPPQQAVVAAPAAPPQNSLEDRKAFEVVSVRPGSLAAERSGRGGAMPSGFGCGGSFLQVDPGHFAISTNVLTLVAMAYGKDCVVAAKLNLLGGGPSWVNSEQFTIQATFPDGSPNYSSRQLVEGNAPQLQAMLRTLLADRFKLILRREIKEMSVYALTVARGGPKLTPFQEGSCDAIAPLTPQELQPGQTTPCLQGFNVNRKSHFNVTANRVTLDRFAEVLSLAFDRPVVNRTGISGIFDLHLESAIDFTMFCREPPNCNPVFTPSDSPPLVFDAIQQQLGLRLESTKAPVETVVVDHVEKPSEN